MSEIQIGKLALALSKAQGHTDREQEGRLTRQFVRKVGDNKFTTNGYDGKSLFERFIEKIAIGMSGCWYWMGHIDGIGYGRFNHPSESKAHRAAWRLFNGNIPAGLKVLHHCDVRGCVNPAHLFLGTQTENMQDALRKGRLRSVPKHGESNPMARLTQKKVARIKEIISKREGTTQRQLARSFGVSPMTICRIVNKKSWVGA